MGGVVLRVQTTPLRPLYWKFKDVGILKSVSRGVCVCVCVYRRAEEVCEDAECVRWYGKREQGEKE